MPRLSRGDQIIRQFNHDLQPRAAISGIGHFQLHVLEVALGIGFGLDEMDGGVSPHALSPSSIYRT